MAVGRGIRVKHEDVFTHGAYVSGDITPVRDFDASRAAGDGVTVQARDRDTGELMWEVPVLDTDPQARKNERAITVKIPGPVQPVPPDALPGLPFRPVVFEGLRVTPYVKDDRVAFSYRASSMHSPAPATAASNGTPSSGKASSSASAG